MRLRRWLAPAILAFLGISPAAAQEKVQPLPGTKPLTLQGDIASQMIDGIDKFLLKQLAASYSRRWRSWDLDFTSAEAHQKVVSRHRKHLATMLGVVGKRAAFKDFEPVAMVGQKEAGLIGKGEGYNIYAVRWPVLTDPHPNRDSVIIHGEGLLLVPTNGKPVADIIAIPHCDQTPEMIVGLAKGVRIESQFARRLAESGCRVIVPTLINRTEVYPKLTWREYLYRSAFELGRHLIGYEVEKVLACVDWFEKEQEAGNGKRSIGVIGYGEGGLIAMHAAALDSRIKISCISGYFGSIENTWQQPIDRNVFGLLNEFGDAGLGVLISPQKLIVETGVGPSTQFAGGRGAPAQLTYVQKKDAYAAMAYLRDNFPRGGRFVPLLTSMVHESEVGVPDKQFLQHTVTSEFFKFQALRELPVRLRKTPNRLVQIDTKQRHQRQAEEIDRYNQLLLRDCAHQRYASFWKKLDLSSVEKYEKSIEPFRKQFRDEVIGRFDIDLLPANARTRKDGETDKWTRYEVVLDVFPDVIAYGLLIVPKGIKPGEQRPVVVCQHGLEGRPQDVIGEKSHRYYKAFATSLAERGFVTFAPQNIYIFRDRFRTLQRKANPLGKTLFSIMVPQHQQITDWLKTQPFVDGKRIGFYGLSYGGKSAMRIPPLVDNYCLSICSADFNEWVWKNASTSPFAERYTYSNKGEYEIFEWDLGHTFNYAEMAALIAPRPFMVERGHDDGVAPDETVAFEYAKVRRLYNKLGIGDRTTIEFFNGPHAIHGKGTFEFLHTHLKWPTP